MKKLVLVFCLSFALGYVLHDVADIIADINSHNAPTSYLDARHQQELKSPEAPNPHPPKVTVEETR
jgi:hypothetical protein